jgi:predicted glycoside hydrolase/deacetylase ChbG (UPF0249 family)
MASMTSITPLLHIDDGGYDEDSVAALIDLVNADRVASFSVLANGPQLPALALWYQALDNDSRPGVFLHFNLVEGPPTAEAVQSLTHDGLFRSKLMVVWQCLIGRMSIDQVRVELEAQLSAVRRLGFDIIGIDSHQHIHGLAPVSAAVSDVAATEHLHVRSLSMFMATSVIGRCKRGLFDLACIVSQFAITRRFCRPSVWRERSWTPYVVASWEPLAIGASSAGAVIVCHPALGHDRRNALK